MADFQEELAWLRGERSSINWLGNGTPEGNVLAQQYDAARTMQAYYICLGNGALAEHPDSESLGCGQYAFTDTNGDPVKCESGSLCERCRRRSVVL